MRQTLVELGLENAVDLQKSSMSSIFRFFSSVLDFVFSESSSIDLFLVQLGLIVGLVLKQTVVMYLHLTSDR